MKNTSLTLDLLLPCLFPLVVLFICIRLFPSLTWGDLRDLLSLRSKTHAAGPFSLPRASNSYAQYSWLAGRELSRMRASFSTLGRAHRRLGYNIGYREKLDNLKGAIEVNARISTAIAKLARQEFGLGDDVGNDLGAGDLGRVRESMKHFVRDWSEEGKEERDKMFAPILDVLASVEQKGDKKVLVPGSGLGRLAWEISQLGACLSSSNTPALLI